MKYSILLQDVEETSYQFGETSIKKKSKVNNDYAFIFLKTSMMISNLKIYYVFSYITFNVHYLKVNNNK